MTKENKMTRKKYYKIVYMNLIKNDKISHYVTEKMIENTICYFLEEVQKSMVNGDPIEFRKLGRFIPCNVPKKIGRNPKDPSVPIIIPETKTIRFKISKHLKQKINSSS